MNPDGVFLSNGPGDPDAVAETYEQVQQLSGKVPPGVLVSVTSSL